MWYKSLSQVLQRYFLWFSSLEHQVYVFLIQISYSWLSAVYICKIRSRSYFNFVVSVLGNFNLSYLTFIVVLFFGLFFSSLCRKFETYIVLDPCLLHFESMNVCTNILCLKNFQLLWMILVSPLKS